MEIKYCENENINFKDLSNEFVKILPNDLLSCLGKKFISEVYLNEFKKSPKNTIIFAKDNSKIVGFILACDSSDLMKRVIINNKVNLLKSLIIYILKSNFDAIKKIVSILRYMFNKTCHYNSTMGIELCYIGIDHNYQQKGIGSMLINKLSNFSLQNKNINEIYVKTLILGNDRAATNFYLKNNFKSVFICEGRNILKRQLR